jgi:hypothetical protein
MNVDEAKHSLPQTATPAQARAMERAVVVLARRMALKRVEMMLRAKGPRPQRMERNTIVATADAYLFKHRSELITEAKGVVDRWHAEGRFGRRGGIRNPVPSAVEIDNENKERSIDL